MIWRGIQFFMVWALVGAAPCWAFPSVVVLEGFGVPTLPDGYDSATLNIDGEYYPAFGDEYVTTYYKAGSNEAFLYVHKGGEAVYLQVDLNWMNNGAVVAFRIRPDGSLEPIDGNVDQSLFLPQFENWVVRFDGAIFAAAGSYLPTDPYPGNFPDWQSAAVKIPLGFGFAMSFWAAAVAASIAMKWVRDLASAAS